MKASAKRHTKPCRYYQIGTCPFNAEHCDFAHIVAPNVRTTPCRYYLSGHCQNGNWCPYKHLDVGVHENGSLSDDLFWDPNDGATDYSSSTLTFPPYPRYYPPPGYSLTPSYVASSLWPHNYPPFLGYPAEDRGIPLTIHRPSISSSNSYDSASPISISPTTSVSSVSDGNLKSDYPMKISKEHSGRPQIRFSKRKAEKYKTKPCKFYVKGFLRSCPNGADCTFIHDSPEENPVVFKPPVSKAPDAKEQEQHELPPKPMSLADENKRKGYYPISWRVIGGGVLMGLNNKVCLAHENENVELESLEETFQPSFSDLQAGDEPEYFPSPDRSTPRAKSISIPSTPLIAAIGAASLFAAESP